MEPSDAELIAAVRGGSTASFEPLVRRYSPRVFATVRRYARREDEAADLAQEIWLKAYQKLSTFRGDAPFEHWLMRLAVRTCYDSLRAHRRNRESNFTDLTEAESDWLDRFVSDAPGPAGDDAAARQLLNRAMAGLSPASRLVLTLLELEDRPVREIARLTGWSIALVKVRAFRARAELRKILARIGPEKYL